MQEGGKFAMSIIWSRFLSWYAMRDQGTELGNRQSRKHFYMQRSLLLCLNLAHNIE